MMYKVTIDGITIHSPDLGIFLPEAQLTEQSNSPGSFSFSIAKGLDGYNVCENAGISSLITVYRNSEVLWMGRPYKTEKDWENQLNITCEGTLAYLRDSIQSPAEYHDVSPDQYLQILLDIHNSQVEAAKQIKKGLVTVTDPNDSIYRYTNWESTLDVIQTDLVDSFGGYLRLRYEQDGIYLDYLADSPRTCDQRIEFGANLLDYTQNKNSADIATVCIPLGAKLEESTIEALEERLTISTVNDGKNYLEIPSAIAQHGRITKAVTFDDVHTPVMLKSKGLAWLQSQQYADMTLSLTALDLADFGLSPDNINLYDLVYCTSQPHGMSASFPLLERKINLVNPEESTFELGGTTKSYAKTVSSAQQAVKSALERTPSHDRVLTEARQHVTDIITAAGKGGHVVFYPSIETPEEMLVMNTTEVETATNVWRWNVNGLGYSNTGYDGLYGTAITMDGYIVGDYIAAGSITAEKLSVTYKNSVESAINLARSDATDDAANYTDTKLKNYYTISEITTKFDVIPGQISAAIADASEMFFNPSSQDKAYIESKLRNYWNQEQTQTAINAAVDQINLSVEHKLDEIRVGADNMLLHTDFSDWSFVNCTHTFVQDGDYGECVRVTATGGEGTSYIRGVCVEQVAPYITGDYTLSIHGKSAMPAGSQLLRVIGCNSTTPLVDNDGFAIVASTATDPDYEIYGKVYAQNGAGLTTSWTRPCWTFTGSEASYTPKIYLMPDVTYIFAKPQYEIGNRMTAFTESSREVGERYYTKSEVYSKTELMMDDNAFAVKVISASKTYTDGQVTNNRERIASLEQTANGLTSRVSNTETKFDEYSTTSEVNSAIQNAASNLSAEINRKVSKVTYDSYVSQTATTLNSKVTATQMTTAINNKASDLTSAFDGKLANYSTKSEMSTAITQSADAITTKVNKKVDKTTFDTYVSQTATTLSSKVSSGQIGTLIVQNSSSVKVAWNAISNYIKLENAQMNIYDSNSKKLISFNNYGLYFYYKAYHVGKIGTNSWVTDESKRGLVFDLEPNGGYMCWAARANSSETGYSVKLLYAQKAFYEYKAGRLYLGAALDTFGNNLMSQGHAGITTSGADVYLPANTSCTSFYGPYKIRNGIICAN